MKRGGDKYPLQTMTGFLKETNNKNWVFYFEKEERNKKVRLFKAVKPWNWETKNLIKTRKLIISAVCLRFVQISYFIPI